MDECLLNDLLECSVCLERLDTSSKVLPCQHTFCKKCLEEIVTTKKELRCPECRVLVTVPIDDLPPNVLLMRILEGMKHVGALANGQKPKKPVHVGAGLVKSPIGINGEQPVSPQAQKGNYQNVIPNLPYARAMFDYNGKEPGVLCLKKGDIVSNLKKIDIQWCQGECQGKMGVFPFSCVQVITPIQNQVASCRALYDFRVTSVDDDTCLSFRKDDTIAVIRRVDENWAEGKLNEKIGIFPLAFVEMNPIAKALMKLSINSQPGPSRVAPPTPTTDQTTPLIPTESAPANAFHSPAANNIANLSTIPRSVEKQSSSSSSPSTTPNSCSSSTNTTTSSSASSTTPNSPQSPAAVAGAAVTVSASATVASPLQRPLIRPPTLILPTSHITTQLQQQWIEAGERRRSFVAESANRHSAEILGTDEQASKDQTVVNIPRHRRSGSDLNPVQLPALYVALYPYKPQKADELELKKGGYYLVTERCQDGWFKGTSNRTQKSGVFPGNYVTLAKPAQLSMHSSRVTSSSPREMISQQATQPATLTAVAQPQQVTPAKPELPPRTGIFSQVLNEQGASSAAKPTSIPKPVEKVKEKKERGSLIKRLASMKRSKSPPGGAASYSMDNPVFDDSPVTSPARTPQHSHSRSGSCPSQLIHLPSNSSQRPSQSSSLSARSKHKERPSVTTHFAHIPSSSSKRDETGVSHRKSNSLDAGDSHKPKQLVPSVRERFRCVVPYPPNSEYELELQVGDIIYVHRKRDDGWYKGTLQRTGKTGLFPASFVESL